MDTTQILQQKPTIDFTLKEEQYELYRLDDEQYSYLRQNSLPIQEDIFFLLALERYFQQENEDLTLAKIYILLTFISGESSKWYDDWKGSFCFPFLIKIIKKERELNNYLLIISDWRGNLEFRFKRLIGDNETYEGIERDIIRKPFEHEFSRAEINYFINYLYSYFVGYFSAIEKYPHDDFLKHIDSNLILYGYTNGEFWQKNYEEYDYYQQRLDELKN